MGDVSSYSLRASPAPPLSRGDADRDTKLRDDFAVPTLSSPRKRHEGGVSRQGYQARSGRGAEVEMKCPHCGQSVRIDGSLSKPCGLMTSARRTSRHKRKEPTVRQEAQERSHVGPRSTSTERAYAELEVMPKVELIRLIPLGLMRSTRTRAGWQGVKRRPSWAQRGRPGWRVPIRVPRIRHQRGVPGRTRRCHGDEAWQQRPTIGRGGPAPFKRTKSLSGTSGEDVLMAPCWTWCRGDDVVARAGRGGQTWLCLDGAAVAFLRRRCSQGGASKGPYGRSFRQGAVKPVAAISKMSGRRGPRALSMR